MTILSAGLTAASPATCIPQVVGCDGTAVVIGDERIDLERVNRVIVVGIGKATAQMAAALETIIGDRITAGVVVTADGYTARTRRVAVMEAGHPVPDTRCLDAARRITALVDDADADDVVIVLISGGGSALLTLPAPPVTLPDLSATNRLLLLSGARIQEINTVRKHLSQVKGGQLAQRAFPARVIAIILSDVPGDPVDMIASGPTVPDPTTFAAGIEILKRYRLWEKVPATVRSRLAAGADGDIPETPKPDNSAFNRVSYVIAGSGTIAAEAAQQEGKRLGYNTLLLTTTLEGEAREVGKVVAAVAREVVAKNRPIPRPALILAAGETTVTVRGDGTGGRNQELALAAALGISGLPEVIIAALGTDGRDGPTDAAGGIVDGETINRIRAHGISPQDALTRNDAYHALAAAGVLINTGPTGTNVADLVAILVCGGHNAR